MGLIFQVFFLWGLEDLLLRRQTHGFVIKIAMESDKYIVSAIIDMCGKCGCELCGKCGCSSQMSQVFDDRDVLDICACSALISGVSRNGIVDEALMVLRQFKDKGR